MKKWAYTNKMLAAHKLQRSSISGFVSVGYFDGSRYLNGYRVFDCTGAFPVQAVTKPQRRKLLLAAPMVHGKLFQPGDFPRAVLLYKVLDRICYMW